MREALRRGSNRNYGMGEENMGSEADRMHRTNTKYEKIKNVSRDIPAYFVRKMTK